MASVLLFSVWLHYDLSVFFFLVSSLTRLVGLFRHSFFFGYPCFLSLAASSVLFLPLEFPLRFGWSSGRLVAFCVPLAWLPSLSGSDVPFTCLGFSATCLKSFPWLFHGVFFREPLLSVLPLGCSCLVGVLGALCLPPFCTFSSFVFFCLQRFFLLYRLPVLFLVLPLSLWFRSCSSPA